MRITLLLVTIGALKCLAVDQVFWEPSTGKVSTTSQASPAPFYLPAGTNAPLTVTAVKTGAYSAAVNDLVPVDATSAGVTITFPNAPADGSRIAVKKIDSSANVVTLQLQGSDVFNKASGSTSGTLSLQFQAVVFQYKASGAIWYAYSADLPLSQLDTRYLAPSAIGVTVQGYNANTTTQGNAFNGASQLVQTDSNGKLLASVPRQGSFSDSTIVTVNTNTTGNQQLNTFTPVTSGVFNVANRHYHVHGAGLLTTNNTSAGNFRLFLGSTQLFACPYSSITSTVTNSYWVFDGYVTVVTTGATGTVYAHGVLMYRTSAGGGNTGTAGSNSGVSIGSNTSAVTVDLTGTPAINMQMNFSANGSTPNTCTQNEFSGEVTN